MGGSSWRLNTRADGPVITHDLLAGNAGPDGKFGRSYQHSGDRVWEDQARVEVGTDSESATEPVVWATQVSGDVKRCGAAALQSDGCITALQDPLWEASQWAGYDNKYCVLDWGNQFGQRRNLDLEGCKAWCLADASCPAITFNTYHVGANSRVCVKCLSVAANTPGADAGSHTWSVHVKPVANPYPAPVQFEVGRSIRVYIS